jgi:hypothetical protein
MKVLRKQLVDLLGFEPDAYEVNRARNFSSRPTIRLETGLSWIIFNWQFPLVRF